MIGADAGGLAGGGGVRTGGTGGQSGGAAAWLSVATDGQPPAAVEIAAAWTGRELLVWGGSGTCTATGACAGGARYRPDLDQWLPISALGAPGARALAASAWTGSVLAIWGGRACGNASAVCGDGALYDPVADAWTKMEAAGAPSARGWATAVWTGNAIVVWGGQSMVGGSLLGDGGAYDPIMRTWQPVPSVGAPSARRYHSAIWTGREVLIWGGNADPARNLGLSDGAAYDPMTMVWRPMSAQGAPGTRWSHAALWTGKEMMIWGGVGCGANPSSASLEQCGDGALYDPALDAWRPVSSVGAPTPRSGHSLVWSGREALVFGGGGGTCLVGSGGLCADGGRYDPMADRWATLVPASADAARAGHAACFTGTDLLVWGGIGPGEGEAPRFDGARLALP